MIRELPEAQVQPAHPQLHSLKSSSPRSSSYKQDSSRERNSRSRITSVLEAQGTRTRFKHEETIKNPAEALMEHFGNPPSSDITHSSVTESADRLFLWESIPKLAEAQTFSVYELNEFDRDSPAFLEFSRQTVNKVDPDTGAHVHALGDQVPFTNKWRGDLQNGHVDFKQFVGSVCELPRYIDEHYRRSGFLQRGMRSSPPTQHLSLQILLHIYTHWHPRTTKASNCLTGTALRIRGCNSGSRCLPSPHHITPFLELS
ncbi:unnamed protein product [Sphagnum troendelagicum]